MFNVDSKTADREQDGVWVTFRDSEFLIAHINNNKFQKLYTRLLLPHRKAVDKKNLDPEIQLDIMAKAMSKHLLLDWKNVVNSKGEPVTYTVEIADRVLRDNTEFRDFVLEVAQDIANFREEEKEDLGKGQEK